MFPPGRARLAANPALTGSEICTKMTGMVRVARCNTATAGVVLDMMTSGAQTHQFGSIAAVAFDVGSAVTILDDDVVVLLPTQTLRAIAKRSRSFG
jgi:hypothetical protein